MRRLRGSSLSAIVLITVAACGGGSNPAASPSVYGPAANAVSVLLANGFTEGVSPCADPSDCDAKVFENKYVYIRLWWSGDLTASITPTNYAAGKSILFNVLKELYPSSVIQAADSALAKAFQNPAVGVGGPIIVGKYKVGAGLRPNVEVTVYVRVVMATPS